MDLGGGRPVEPGDALVVATSGTTGRPKGVVLTHAAVAASAEATSARLGVASDDHWLACLPLAHVGGLSVVTRALAMGTPLTVLPGFEVDAVTAGRERGPRSCRWSRPARTDRPRAVPADRAGRRPAAGRPAGQRDHHLRDDRDRQRRGLRRPTARRRGGPHRSRRRDRPARTRCCAATGTTSTPRTGRVGWRPATWARGWGRVRAPASWCTGGPATSSSPAGRTCGPSPWKRCSRLPKGWPRWPWPGGPTLSGASGSWPSSCRAMPPGRRRWTELRAVAKERLPAFAAPRELVLVDALPRTALGKAQRASLP